MDEVLAASGINQSEVPEYAVPGTDIIILSPLYFGKPADIGVRNLPKI